MSTDKTKTDDTPPGSDGGETSRTDQPPRSSILNASSPGLLSRPASIAFGLGVAFSIALLLYFDAPLILGLLFHLGFGLLPVLAVHQGAVFCNAAAWKVLIAAQGAGSALLRLFWLRWLADAVNALLPLGLVGGEVLRGHLLARAGRQSHASVAAAILIDLTLGALALASFIFLGLMLLAARQGASDVVPGVLGVLGLAGPILGLLLIMAQHRRKSEPTAGPGTAFWQRMAGGLDALRAALASLCRQPGPLLGAGLLRLASWLTGAAETWLSLTLLGYPCDFIDALILESLVQAARNAAFAVPAGVGVQEGTLVVVGQMLGLPAPASLALGLVRRLRDLCLGVPALLVWRLSEARRPCRDAAW